jgi:hypothetical protein
MEVHMEIYDPYKKENIPEFSSWEEVFEKSLLLVNRSSLKERNSPVVAFGLWQRGVSNYIESLGIKNDLGFSRGVIFNNRTPTTLITNLQHYAKQDALSVEISQRLQEKMHILRILKEKVNLVATEGKLFDYLNGQYYLNRNPINPSKTTLYYVLFNATYQLRKTGGDISYLELKNFLIENKITYKKDNKNCSFRGIKLSELRVQVRNNLLGRKGILKLVDVSKNITDKKVKIFFAVRNSDLYTFNNKIKSK